MGTDDLDNLTQGKNSITPTFPGMFYPKLHKISTQIESLTKNTFLEQQFYPSPAKFTQPQVVMVVTFRTAG